MIFSTSSAGKTDMAEALEKSQIIVEIGQGQEISATIIAPQATKDWDLTAIRIVPLISKIKDFSAEKLNTEEEEDSLGHLKMD